MTAGICNINNDTYLLYQDDIRDIFEKNLQSILPNLVVKMTENLIFLGSGASAPFGLPTMKELVKSFEIHLQKNARE
jgi:hypothetical protein